MKEWILGSYGVENLFPNKGHVRWYNKFLIDVLLKNELHGGLRDWDGVHQELSAGLPQAVNQVRKSSSSIKIKMYIFIVSTILYYVLNGQYLNFDQGVPPRTPLVLNYYLTLSTKIFRVFLHFKCVVY